jgi:hypothetical protein
MNVHKSQPWGKFTPTVAPFVMYTRAALFSSFACGFLCAVPCTFYVLHFIGV